MRICFFNDVDFLGGGELWVLKACSYLQSLNHEVVVICPTNSALHKTCLETGVPVFSYLIHEHSNISFHQKLEHLFVENEIDIVYCTVMGRFGEVKLLETVADRINESGAHKVMIILKTGLPPMDNLSPTYYGVGAGSAVRRLHVVSKSVKKAFGDWYPPMTKGFTKVFYEGTNTNVFNGNGHSKEASKLQWQVPANFTVVSCVARLDGMKGQSVLLRAIPHVLREFPETVFLFAGEGNDRDMLEELTEDLGLQASVKFLGHIRDVHSLLSATNILCHPSLNDGIPNSIMEAMAMSVPIVASDLPGIQEAVSGSETAVLVRPNDVNGLKKALCNAIRDQQQDRPVNFRDQRRFASQFTFSTNMDRLLSSLETELTEFKASPWKKTAPKNLSPNHTTAVLFIFSEIRLGGEETELGIISRYIDKQQFHLSVLSCYPTREEAPVYEKLRHYDVPVDLACNNIADEKGKVHYIIEKIKREGIGIVVACQETKLAYEVFKHFSSDQCRFIEHGGLLKDVVQIPKDRTARYIGVSREITHAASKCMEDPKAAVFIPSMVDTDEYDHEIWNAARTLTKHWLRETLLDPYGFTKDCCVVTFLGRLDPKKRIEDFVQAARLIHPHCPQAFFLIIGGTDSFEPEYAEQLARDANDLVESGCLAFTGTRGDIAGLLCASNILVLPSVGEGMAHVINEAGAAGLAVIATDDGAAREQLEDGNCGCIVTPYQVDELAEAMKKLIADKRLRQKLGKQLKEKVRHEYAARKVISLWHAVFREEASKLTNPLRRQLLRPNELYYHQLQQA